MYFREESDITERLPFHISLSCIGEENGTPLQCSCLENPRDGRAWWAAVSGIAQSRTRLKRLSSSSSSSRVYMRRREIAGSYGGFVLSFLRNLHTVFHSVSPALLDVSMCPNPL